MPKTQKQPNFDYNSIFNNSFIPIWIENVAPLYQEFSVLKKSGITDLSAYLENYPEKIPQLASKIVVLDVNEATVSFYKARNKAVFLGNLGQMMSNIDHAEFATALVSFWNQDKEIHLEATHQTFDSEPLSVILSARIPRFDSDQLVISVTITDVTALVEKQQTLAKALEEITLLRESFPSAHPANASGTMTDTGIKLRSISVTEQMLCSPTVFAPTALSVCTRKYQKSDFCDPLSQSVLSTCGSFLPRSFPNHPPR